MDSFFIGGGVMPAMVRNIRFLSVRLRAMAQATESEERVLQAIAFASGSDDINRTITQGHFGNSIAVFEAELKKAAEIRRFTDSLVGSGILPRLRNQIEARTDEGGVFHFRLGKQEAYAGKLEIASGRDVIDVRMKVGVYPARRVEAVRLLSEWADAMSK